MDNNVTKKRFPKLIFTLEICQNVKCRLNGVAIILLTDSMRNKQGNYDDARVIITVKHFFLGVQIFAYFVENEDSAKIRTRKY